MALVSILVPTYNQAAFVAEAVQSALCQDYEPLEIIVGDDASTDDTQQRLAPFRDEPRVRLHVNARNLGRVANYRQLLYEHARGDWILNLDGDDYLTDRTYVRKALSLAGSDDSIVLVFGKALIIRERTGGSRILNDLEQMPLIMCGNDFLFRFPPFGTLAPLHMTAVYRREEALALDFYRADILSSDFESLYRLVLGRKVGFLDAVAGVWRQHDGNATRLPSYEELRKNKLIFRSLYEAAIQANAGGKSQLDMWYRRRLARYLLSSAKALAKQGAFGSAFLLCRELWREDHGFWRQLPAAAGEILRGSKA